MFPNDWIIPKGTTGIKVPNNLTFLSVKERSLSLGIIGKTRNEQKTLTVSCPVKQYSRVALLTLRYSETIVPKAQLNLVVVATEFGLRN
ncbi:hypothetical protein V1477_001296 [Vespula maculifrons]|uniref:Uncharacterized protein n=1 Tax=Vespula maculifrons TaxID=7453 RepID=A0ABD2CZC9_VESMC